MALNQYTVSQKSAPPPPNIGSESVYSQPKVWPPNILNLGPPPPPSPKYSKPSYAYDPLYMSYFQARYARTVSFHCWGKGGGGEDNGLHVLGLQALHNFFYLNDVIIYMVTSVHRF